MTPVKTLTRASELVARKPSLASTTVTVFLTVCCATAEHAQHSDDSLSVLPAQAPIARKATLAKTKIKRLAFAVEPPTHLHAVRPNVSQAKSTAKEPSVAFDPAATCLAKPLVRPIAGPEDSTAPTEKFGATAVGSASHSHQHVPIVNVSAQDLVLAPQATVMCL